MGEDPSDEVTVEFDPDTGEYSATFDPETVDASIAVIEATATVRRAGPDRHAPLFEVIDPDALDRICAGRDGETLVEFTYLDHRIGVSSTGRISVVPNDTA